MVGFLEFTLPDTTLALAQGMVNMPGASQVLLPCEPESFVAVVEHTGYQAGSNDKCGDCD